MFGALSPRFCPYGVLLPNGTELACFSFVTAMIYGVTAMLPSFLPQPVLGVGLAEAGVVQCLCQRGQGKSVASGCLGFQTAQGD